MTNEQIIAQALAQAQALVQTLSQPATSVPVISKVNLVFPAAPNFYSPTIIATATGFDMWVTNADRIARYKSVDGKTWTGGNIVFSAIHGTWEDDGNSYEGTTTGISDPRILKNVTGGWAYTMYYTGGIAPNTSTSGGIGCAVSQDGISWSRVGSGMLRSFPGGNTFMTQAMTIAGKRYLYFLGGGNAAAGIPPVLMVSDDMGDGIHFAGDRAVGLPRNSVPLFYDAAAGSCWTAVGSSASAPSGPVGFDIYKGGNGFTTLGTQIATIDSTVTGNVSNMYPQAVRTDQGLRIGTGPVQIFFSTGNSWGGWQPASVMVNA